jgi:EAL domain-containing protein (putative c-di-GMP-specific phosphodiesterase class I)
MSMVQAAIVRAVSGLYDSRGILTLVGVVQTSAQLAYTRSGCSSIQGFYETQADPAGESAALLVNLISSASGRSEARTNDDLSSREQWLAPCR